MVKASVKVKLNIKPQDFIKILGFGNGGTVQKIIDNEVVRLSDPYAPSDTTALRKSAYIKTAFGSGEVTYSIYGNPDGVNTWNDTKSQFQDRPMRGPFWVKRMLEAGGREKILLAIENWFRKKA